METRTVTDCEGYLFDSENGDGDFPTGYGHNERLTFTICVPDAEKITISFSQFDMEPENDYMEFYDGPDRNSPLIARRTGVLSPFVIESTGECLTIYFYSDGSKRAEGWEAFWTVDPPEPEDPNFLPIGEVNCGDNSIIVEFDSPIPCEELRASNFAGFNGPAGQNIASVTPLNCVDGYATRAEITFTGPLDESGTYYLFFEYILANCVRPFQLEAATTFDIIDCPLELILHQDTAICLNTCGWLWAEARGGDPSSYQFDWTPNLPNSDSVQVCPTENTTYTVSVSDGNSQPVTASVEVTILALPDAGEDFDRCEFDTDTILTANPPNGYWYGPGMNGAGRFRPRAANEGVHTVTFVDNNGCRDEVEITVHDVNPGGSLALCLSAGNYVLGGTPAGGTWTGPGVVPSFEFDPTQVGEGNYTITYTEPNFGCSADLAVEVVDEVKVPAFDSIQKCSSEPTFRLEFSPLAGRWTGVGITNSYWGDVSPAAIGNQKVTLYYTLDNGCNDSTNVEVFAIDAGPDIALCPTDSLFDLLGGSPNGGTWNGNSVSDVENDGIFAYNPNYRGNTATFTDTLNYEIGTCSDTILVYVLKTSVEDITFDFCEYNGVSPLPLSTVNTFPNGGTWTLDNYAADQIDIQAFGGDTTVYAIYNFNNNTCYDSVQINIKPKPIAGLNGADTSVCRKNVDFDLTGTPAGGTWDGFGIIDENQGTFSPTTIGVNGTFLVTYSFNGCEDTMAVVIEDPVPYMTGFTDEYCQDGEVYVFTGKPDRGSFSGNGIIASEIGPPTTADFSPNDAGFGYHDIVYTVGQDECTFRDTITLFVFEALTATMEAKMDIPLCNGDSIPFEVTVSGGDTTVAVEYIWSYPEFGNVNYVITRPTKDTSISVRVTDRCSEDVLLSSSIAVNREIQYFVQKGQPLCYGEPNWVRVTPVGFNSDHQIVTWYEDQSFVSDSIFNFPDRYPFTILDTVTGCEIRSSERIDEYPEVIADFIFQPFNDECLSIMNPTLYVINNSAGADRGEWRLTDTLYYFHEDFNIYHEYSDTGIYAFELFVSNEIGCTDTKQDTICVDKETRFWVPTAFTPNNDNKNEFWPEVVLKENGRYTLQGYDQYDYQVTIYNRWGEIVFENKVGNNAPWDGLHKDTGLPVEPGVYQYYMSVYFNDINYIEFEGTVTLLR